MVDLKGKDRGNISLPPRLQSPGILDPDFVYDENFVPIINMQKALYDIRISDTEKRIQRLETRNNEILEENQETEIVIKSVDLATEDEIAYLNKDISVETEKIESISRKIDDTSRLREEERQAHLKNVEMLNEKYENTRCALTSAIKALNAKINTLEDYKNIRVALWEKLRLGDETISRNEEEIAQKQDAINRKFKIDREKLKNEMYNRLLALAGTFQLEISDTISLPVHRLLRENIFIKSEMMQIVDETLRRKDNFTGMRSMETVHQNSIKSSSLERRNNLITIKIQRCLLKALKKMHLSMKKRLECLNTPEEFAQEIYDDLADSVRTELAMFEARTGKLEVLLHRESIKLGRAKFIKNQTESRAKIYEEIFYDVKYVVACALKMTETGQDILEMNESELYSHLLNLFLRGQSRIQCLAVASTESVARPDEVYAKGDLGFEPGRIDFDEPEILEDLTKAKSAETMSRDISETSASILPAASLEFYEFEGSETQVMSTEESSEIPDEVSTEESKESSDHKEDISEAPESVSHKSEESPGQESEEHEEEEEEEEEDEDEEEENHGD